MPHFGKMLLTIAAGLYILSLTSLATGLKSSSTEHYHLTSSSESCSHLDPWHATSLLAILVALSTPWSQTLRFFSRLIYKDAKLITKILYNLRIAIPLILYNMAFTILNCLWWRPVASAICIALGTIFETEIQAGWNTFFAQSYWKIAFICLFVFKFVKVVVHTISYLTYTPRLPSETNTSYTANDVTAIIPSIDNFGFAFTRCVLSVLQCKPAHIIIATIESKKDAAENACKKISKDLKVITIKEANKRAQFLEAVSHANTKIIVTADDQVYWGPNFLKYALAPFDDAHVGMVGTIKRVDRDDLPMFSLLDIVNYISVILLERHNFERTATSNIDDGVSGISGRCALMRADLVNDPAFKRAYLNETWFFGARGPLIVDDDKFVSRWCWSHGWKTVFYNHKEALMRTSIAVEGWPKLSLKMHRWARTSWRGNSTELFVQRSVWRQQPWSVYATYFATSVNIALIYDSLLWLTLFRSGWAANYNWLFFGLILFASKLIKPLPHLLRRKRDMAYIPVGILFGYYHGFIRLWALATALDISWGSRDLKAVSVMAPITAAPATSASQIPHNLDLLPIKESEAIRGPAVSPIEVAAVKGKSPKKAHGNESPQAISYAHTATEHHSSLKWSPPLENQRRNRRSTIAF